MYTVFDLKITVFLSTVMYRVILQLLWNICIKWIDIHNKKLNLYIHIYHIYGTQHYTFTQTALSFPRVIIISPFFLRQYITKLLYICTFLHLLKQFSIWKMVYCYKYNWPQNSNILIITRGSQETETLNSITWATTIV